MNSFLISIFKQRIQSKQGNDFEDFINELYLLRYGKEYLPIRRVKDKGNDGTILSESKVIACFAPNKYNKKQFQTKAIGDFKKYKTTWETQYSNWEMIVNHEVAPEALSLINSLEGQTSIMGLDNIIALIKDDLTTNKQRKLAKFLEIDGYFKQDYIEDILNDLLSSSTTKENVLKFSTAGFLALDLKIKLNLDEEDIDSFNEEMIFLMPDFPTIAKLLSGYESEELDVLKWRIMEDYGRLSGNFKNRLLNLTELYSKQYGGVIEDDEYRKCVKTVLLYMFEQCLIGKKVR